MSKTQGTRHWQKGAILVEFALSVSLFLILVLGIIEFALLLFDMSRANEMTRGLSRLAITGDPVCDIFGARSELGACDTGTLICPATLPDPPPNLTMSLADVNTTSEGSTGYRLLERAQQLLPAIGASEIQITYTCSGTGNPFRPQPVPLVTVSLEDYTRPFLLGGFLGLDAGFDFPAFEVTRLGEDLYTEG